MTANDRQEGGAHYTSMDVQPWEALESWLTPEQFEGYLLGCIINYLARFNAKGEGKGGLGDLRKALHCLQKLIEALEANAPTLKRITIDGIEYEVIANRLPEKGELYISDRGTVCTAPYDFEPEYQTDKADPLGRGWCREIVRRVVEPIKENNNAINSRSLLR